MTQTGNTKKFKALSEQVIVIAIVAILMGVFSFHSVDESNQLTHTGLHSAAITFNGKLNAVHAQWFMDKQPDVVHVREVMQNDKNSGALANIPVNKLGWVNILPNTLNDNGTACQQIWFYLIDGPLKVMNDVVNASQISESGKNLICRYQVPSGAYFDYSSMTGKVTNVVVPNP